jgi:hypothetical protein
MFAAALSGMRAAGTGDEGRVAPIDYKLVPKAGEDSASERDWRNWINSDFSSFEEERACPIFFQKDVPGFGAFRISSTCNADEGN